VKRVGTRSLPRQIIYSLVPLGVLLGALEIGFWLTDAGGHRGQPLSAGFDAGARYLVPDESAPGAWRTQIWGAGLAQDELVIPPKGDRRRVLLLGGSNTRSFPEAELELLLNDAAPGPGYEVINLGRGGYGSERVQILFEQAIELEPDVVVIYSGHNEFVEAGFAMELAERGATARWMRFLDSLQGLRTLNLMVTAFHPPANTADTTLPEALRRSRSEFRKLTYEQTLVFFEQYRANIARMCQLAVDRGARVVLSTVIGNMLYRPSDCSLPTSFDARQISVFKKSLASALDLVPERFSELFSLPIEPRFYLWRANGRGAQSVGTSPLAAGDEQPPVLRPLLGALATSPASSATEAVVDSSTIAGPHWTDPSEWQPGLRSLIDSVGEFHRRQLSPEETRDLEQARELLGQLLASCADHPRVTFYLGLCTYLLGEDDSHAVELLVDAGRYDRAPRRANAVTNGILRELAATHDPEDLVLLDAEAMFRERCPDGLIGWEVMMDVCHLHPGTRSVLMQDFAQAILTP
jgi:hypothetical protein